MERKVEISASTLERAMEAARRDGARAGMTAPEVVEVKRRKTALAPFGYKAFTITVRGRAEQGD